MSCVDNTALYEYLNPHANDRLTKMTKIDILFLFLILNNSYLTLRDTLNLNNDVTFGIEIEFEKLNTKNSLQLDMLYFLNRDWDLKTDFSVITGGEISSPIMKDSKETWISIEDICGKLSPISKIGNNCGGHVHVGANILSDKFSNWHNFAKLWASYENIIFRFCYGNYLNARTNISKYAILISERLWSICNLFSKEESNLSKFIKECAKDGYQSVNFSHIDISNLKETTLGNTIEFRCPNGSLNAVIWQNNINLFVKLLEYSKSDSFDHETVEKRYFLNKFKGTNLDTYGYLDVQGALELADLIFDNNLDKCYFLKQYLKFFGIKEDIKTRKLEF